MKTPGIILTLIFSLIMFTGCQVADMQLGGESMNNKEGGNITNDANRKTIITGKYWTIAKRGMR